ncbi:CD99 antigen-like protein 2 isoform X4 [Phyllobates terribilis]|uniref:CD99 antigen-like protein 2 isoform X4 n=1 Tax=Phyllobates terribilis TaxID=111132 RepID=UPI003CCA845B
MARLGFTLVLVALVWRAHGQGDFSLEDAFDDIPTPKPKPAPKPPKIPTRNTDDFDLSDFFDTTNPPKVVPKRPTKKPDPHDFSLEDALDPKNDPNKGDFSDSDLDDIMNGGYKPDKGRGRDKGDGRHQADDRDQGQGNLAETGTIAGIASALVMALVGAVSSYISYQQKKFCFSIQQGLNAEYVKGENMEAVMVEEPQVKYSALEHQSAATPTGDPSKV